VEINLGLVATECLGDRDRDRDRIARWARATDQQARRVVCRGQGGRRGAGQRYAEAGQRDRTERRDAVDRHALHVARLGNVERRIDEDLNELARRQHRADHVALGAERRDERRQDDQPGVGNQLGDLADAADVLDPVGLGEAEILVRSGSGLFPRRDYFQKRFALTSAR